MSWTNWNLLALQRLLTVQCGVNLLFGTSLGQNSPTVASHYIQLPSDLETNQLAHCHLLQRSTLFFQSQMKPAILRFAEGTVEKTRVEAFANEEMANMTWQKNNGHSQELWHEISDCMYIQDSFWRLPSRVTINNIESTLRNRKGTVTVPLKSQHHATPSIAELLLQLLESYRMYKLAATHPFLGKSGPLFGEIGSYQWTQMGS